MLGSLLKSLFSRKTRSATTADASLERFAGLLEAGRLDEAERIARNRVDAAPHDPDALSALAGVTAEQGRLSEACELAERLGGQPQARADHICAAAEIFRRAGREAKALQLSTLACDKDPQNAIAWILRAALHEALGEAAESLSAYRTAIALRPGNRNLHSSMLYMMYVSGVLAPEDVAKEHRAWAERHADVLTPRQPQHSNSAQPDRPLKIGYVSPDFRRHVVAYFIEPVLSHHDRSSFRVHCYSSSSQVDDRTAVLRSLADDWCDISAMDDGAVAERVRADGIDVLVDLSGHTRGNRLLVFARKPAPVQISWLGYLGTTGMKAMDYCLTDDFSDPPGIPDAHYTERLLRLPVPQWCYAPPDDAPLPSSRTDRVTFASLANYGRLTSEIFDAWARILQAVPEARLKVFGVTSGDPSDRLLDAFDKAGISIERLELQSAMPHARYLAALSEADIVLGAYPYSGATTTCEALWMGVPLVARAGQYRAARSSASILNGVGLGEFIAEDQEKYIEIAVSLARNADRLAAMRAGLRQRLRASSVADGAVFTTHLERAYRDAWRQWCRASSGW
jgi:protein O-GlcNAc transferase